MTQNTLFNLDPAQFRLSKGPGVRLMQKVDNSQLELGKLLSALPKPSAAPAAPTQAAPVKPASIPENLTLPPAPTLDDSVVNFLNGYKSNYDSAVNNAGNYVAHHNAFADSLIGLAPSTILSTVTGVGADGVVRPGSGRWNINHPAIYGGSSIEDAIRYNSVAGPGRYGPEFASLLQQMDDLLKAKNTNLAKVEDYKKQRTAYEDSVAPYKDDLIKYASDVDKYKKEVVDPYNSAIDSHNKEVESYKNEFSRIAQDFNNSRQQYGTVDQKRAPTEGEVLADSQLYSDNLHQMMLDRVSAANAEPIEDRVSSLFTKGK